MEYLSLFSGAGGGDLGYQHLLGWECKGYVEWDDYCCRALEQRIKDGFLTDAPIFQGDIRRWLQRGYARSYQGMVDCITGGFPCQPFSVAGKRAGRDDERNLWPATIECVRIIRPRYCFFENVPGLLSSGYFGTIVADLVACGYRVRWRCLSASELGAPHRRDRLWIVADADSQHGFGGGESQQPYGTTGEAWYQPGRCGQNVADAPPRGFPPQDHGERRDRQRRRVAVGRHEQAAQRQDGQVGGKLNPEFVEFLMGWPRGWTSLEPIVSHVIMGYQLEFQRRLNDREIEARTREVLPVLRKSIASQAVSEPVRGLGFIQTQEVLRPTLYGESDDQGESGKIGSAQTDRSSARRRLRNMRNDREPCKPPQGRRLEEQCPQQPSDIVRLLSHEMALAEWEESVEAAIGLQDLWGACQEAGYVSKALPTLQEVWRSLSDQEKEWVAIRLGTGNSWCAEWPGVPRIATGITAHRVNRLKALGNGQVPLCAAAAWQLLTEGIGENHDQICPAPPPYTPPPLAGRRLAGRLSQPRRSSLLE